MGAERYSGTEDARKECVLYCDSKTENSDKSIELTEPECENSVDSPFASRKEGGDCNA